MADKTSSLVVSLIDRVTAPARAVAASIKSISQAASQTVGGAGLVNLQNRLRGIHENNSRSLQAMRGNMLEAAAAAYALQRALSAPLSKSGEFEGRLLDIAQKSDMPKNKMIELGVVIRRIARDVNQPAMNIAYAMDTLTGAGMKPDDASRSLDRIGRIATAYKANANDLAKTTWAAVDNMKVPLAALTKMFDGLAAGGKEGNFELKDMAMEFPKLTAAAAALNMRGVSAVNKLGAAAQISRKGAGSSSEAANNMMNLLQKFLSEDAAKNFKERGINVRKEFEAAQKRGDDEFVTMISLMKRATKTSEKPEGDLSRLGELFSDIQVKNFVNAMWPNLDEYQRILKAMNAANDVVDNDFSRRMDTFEAQFDSLKIAIDDTAEAVGESLTPSIKDLLAEITPLVQRFEGWIRQNPRLVSNIVRAVSALVALRVGLIASAYSAAFMKGAVLSVVRPVIWLTGAITTLGARLIIAPLMRAVGAASLFMSLAFRGARGSALGLQAAMLLFSGASGLASIGRGMLALLNPINLVKGAMVALKFAIASTGVGLLLLAIAAAGMFIYENWSGLTVFFQEFGAAFMAALGPAAPMVQPLIQAAKDLYNWFSSFFGEISPDKWKAWGAAAGTAVGGFVKSAIDLGQKIGAFIISLPGLISDAAVAAYQMGLDWGSALWEGIKAKISAMIKWLGNVPGLIVSGATDVSKWATEKTTGAREWFDKKRGEVAPNGASGMLSGIIPSWMKPAPATPGAPVPGTLNAEAVSIAPKVDRTDIDAAATSANTAVTALEGLDTSVKPRVDNSDMIKLVDLATQVKALLASIGPTAAAAIASAKSSVSGIDIGGEVNRSIRSTNFDTAF